MSPWTALVDSVVRLITWTSGALGVSQGLSILVVTFAVRTAVIPITLPLAKRTRAWQRTQRKIKPAIKEVRERYKDDPRTSMKEVEALHAAAGIGVVDKSGAIGALIQLPLLIAFFTAVINLSEGTPLAEASLLLGLVAGAISLGSAWLGGQAQSKILLGIFTALPVAIVLWLGAGVGFYLVAFYAATLLQSVLMGRDESAD